MDDNLAQKAIEEALRGNWKEAVDLNEEIVEEEPKNKEALNRLARAYLELGKVTKSSGTYKKVLKLDPYNSIAQKALERLKSLKSSSVKKNGSSSSPIAANLFIEEPGKTKAVTLIHLGAPQIIVALDAGQSVLLEPHAHRVSVMTEYNEFIGRLPDDLSSRMIKLTQAGNKYLSYIRSVSPECVKIFIREVERAPQFKDSPSFPPQERTSYVAFTSPEDIHDERPDTSTAEESDDTE